MPGVLDLSSCFRNRDKQANQEIIITDKAALIRAIKKNAGIGAGKSLSTTLLFSDPSDPKKEASHARVKISNFYAWYRRGIWGCGLDPDRSDTVAEFIASRMAHSLSDKARDGYESAPKTDLFADKKGAFGLASFYVQGVQGSLDDMHDKAIEEASLGKVSKHKKHVLLHCSQDQGDQGMKINPDNPKQMIIGGDLKKELYDRIALRAMMGDHDGNPGNYLIVKGEDGKDHVAGIDYGHAFNDMIKSLSGGKLGQHGMLNYLNGKMLNGGQNKLHRSFTGLVPDPDFAAALRDASSPEKVVKMKEAAHKAVQELKELKARGVNEKRLADTLRTLCARLGQTVSKTNNQNFDDLAIRLETAVCDFTEKNAKEARSVANLIDIQTEVYKALKEGREVDMKLIGDLYKQDEQYLKGKSFNDKIEWPKSDLDSSAKKCSLASYVASRAKHFGKSSSEAKDLKITIATLPDGPISETTKRGILTDVSEAFSSLAKKIRGGDKLLAQKVAGSIDTGLKSKEHADDIAQNASQIASHSVGSSKSTIARFCEALKNLFTKGASKETKSEASAALVIATEARQLSSISH